MAYNIKKSARSSGKVFDISTIEGIKRAEKYQKMLYNKFTHVKIEPFSVDRIRLEGVNKTAFKSKNPIPKSSNKNSFAKLRKVDDPYEVWGGIEGWEVRVLKKNQIDDNKPYASWFVATKSPYTFGSWDYGDMYVSELKKNFKKIK